MKVLLHHLWLFPLVAGTAWLVALLTLLIAWFAKGMPQYPGQSNPYVPYELLPESYQNSRLIMIRFVSDIGAFELKPVFLICAIMTGLGFIGTTCSVHYARYSSRMYGLKGSRIAKAVSCLAIIASIVAGVNLIMLSIMDTYRFQEAHRNFLGASFLGLGCSAACTTWVYLDQTRKRSPYRRLREYCVVNTAIQVCELGLGAAFMVLLNKEWYRIAGFLEWTVTILGSFWLLNFIGYLA
ncbi:Frag1/DRAM/Sfk1 [Calycina marina]|uniref:Frag1/DRAM/Sfk1 n=1 Tax=Calycina marina TaxID=1763456 RepID=A0A9P7Z4X4_9HELO|nr:Frag1/DRAM/Sfk1 [Calycina marina]